MIEAWLSASDTIRSVSPVIVGMTPVLAVKPDWKVRTAGVPLNAASSASSASCIDIVPAIVRTAPAADPELADGRERPPRAAAGGGSARGSRSTTGEMSRAAVDRRRSGPGPTIMTRSGR